MKTLRTLFFGLLLMSTYLACSPKTNFTSSAATLTQKLNAIAANWENMYDQDPHSSCDSYLPERGVRIRYQRAQPELGLFMVESIVGKKAFIEGPHTQGFDCSSTTSFGHYNPEFLSSLHEIVKTTFNSKRLVDNFQGIYDTELRDYLRNYYRAYEVGTGNEGIMSNYLKQLNPATRDEDPGWYLQEALRFYSDEMESQGHDWYESNTCAGFWVRRSIDSTADKFYEMLKTTMEIFDPGFMNS